MEELLQECVDELCLHCGKYINEHEGACEGCKWYSVKNGEFKRNRDAMQDCVEDLIVNCSCEDCYTMETNKDGTFKFIKC